MATTKIEWSQKVWNPVTGCTKVSQGCKNCYAEVIANRFSRTGIIPGSGIEYSTADAPKNEKFTVLLHPDRLGQPLKWRKPAKVFVNSMSDLFHESVPFEFINKVFAVMVNADKHIFQILTKRPERALEYFNWAMDQKRGITQELWKKLLEHYYTRDICNLSSASIYETQRDDVQLPTSTKEFRLKKYNLPFKNVWIGVSVEDQKTADERIPLLLQIPAAVRFLSCEPLLGSIDIQQYLHDSNCMISVNPDCCTCAPPREICIDWVICGGESGHGARPMHPDWARKLRDDCQAAGVPYFFKQWGEWGIVKSDLVAGANKKTMIRLNYDGTFKPCHEAIYNSNGVISMARRGKKYTGRLLDGVEHNGMPGKVK